MYRFPPHFIPVFNGEVFLILFPHTPSDHFPVGINQTHSNGRTSSSKELVLPDDGRSPTVIWKVDIFIIFFGGLTTALEPKLKMPFYAFHRDNSPVETYQKGYVFQFWNADVVELVSFLSLEVGWKESKRICIRSFLPFVARARTARITGKVSEF